MSEPKVNKRIKSLDDLLGVGEAVEIQQTPPTDAIPAAQDSNTIYYIPSSKIRDFHSHPFKPYEGEQLEDMVASIKDNGIINPVLVRKLDADEDYEYELLAGHNRRNAALLAGIDTIPCIIKEPQSEEEALMYVIETNVLQRSFKDMTPSEKGAVLSIRHSKMFSQGKRNDIIAELKLLENPQYNRGNETSPLIGAKLRSDQKLGDEYGLSKNTVARLIRIDKLIPDLKNRVDNGEIPLYPAVDLSYLAHDEQNMVEAVLSENEFKVDMKKSELLRSHNGTLTDDLAYQIISGEKTKKPKSSTPPPVKIKHTVYAKYFTPETKQSDIEKTIDEALAFYFAHKNDDKEAE